MHRWAVLTEGGALTFRDTEPTLDAMRREVDGLVEAYPSPKRALAIQCYVNERGRGATHDLLLNPKATTFLTTELWPGTRIVGPMVITGVPNEDGSLKPLDDETVSALREVFP